MIKKRLVVLSGKGGVGKSTVAVNIAAGLADSGFKVGLLDIDLHGPNVPRMLGLVGKNLEVNDEEKIIPVSLAENLKVVSIAFLTMGNKPIVWRGPLKHKMIQEFVEKVEWGDLDFLVIDSPPGTGDEILSTFQLLKNIDGTILVSTPQQVSIDDVERAKEFVKLMNSKILGLVLNMTYVVCPKCGEKIPLFPQKTITEELPVLMEFPMDPQVAASTDDGKPVVWFMRNSEIEKRFRELIEKVLELLGS
ncbi:MAG: Mrp/NBP35 family ATP-binding protein [Thermotogae bacterium]|nr:Mrp/NBP35 family ATP-binding protein [Thermotogota bacterium]